VAAAGIVLCALSQYLYLCKFFVWEIGYMRSIDIIVDRAGFYETWGCLVWVPSVYTLHTRLLVTSPSGLSWEVRPSACRSRPHRPAPALALPSTANRC
jgi:7-dehydrocholesterol reductase